MLVQSDFIAVGH